MMSRIGKIPVYNQVWYLPNSQKSILSLVKAQKIFNVTHGLLQR